MEQTTIRNIPLKLDKILDESALTSASNMDNTNRSCTSSDSFCGKEFAVISGNKTNRSPPLSVKNIRTEQAIRALKNGKQMKEKAEQRVNELTEANKLLENELEKSKEESNVIKRKYEEKLNEMRFELDKAKKQSEEHKKETAYWKGRTLASCKEMKKAFDFLQKHNQLNRCCQVSNNSHEGPVQLQPNMAVLAEEDNYEKHKKSYTNIAESFQNITEEVIESLYLPQIDVVNKMQVKLETIAMPISKISSLIQE